MQNAECKMQNAKLGDGANVVQTEDKRITISQPHVAQFATYHDGFAVYITASQCDAYISCDSVALYHAPWVHIILHWRLRPVPYGLYLITNVS